MRSGKEASLETLMFLHWVLFFKWIESLVLQKWLGKEVMHEIKWRGACKFGELLMKIRWWRMWSNLSNMTHFRKKLAGGKSLYPHISLGSFVVCFLLHQDIAFLPSVQVIHTLVAGGLMEVGACIRNWLEVHILLLSSYMRILKTDSEIGEEEATETAIS